MAERTSGGTQRDGWQLLLGDILRDTEVRQALADDLGYSPITLVRWAQGTAEPHEPERKLWNLASAKHFPSAFREQFLAEVKKCFPAFREGNDPLMMGVPVKEIPSIFYSQIFHAYTSVAPSLNFWTITNLVCRQLFGHIDADQSAEVSILLLVCTAPQGVEKIQQSNSRIVRSLHAPVRQISDRPSPISRIKFPLFLGTESLFAEIRPLFRGLLVFSEQEIQKVRTVSLPLSLDVKSMAFLPIQRRGKIAAGLVVTSHKPEYFTQARQEVVYEYGSLLSLAFDDQDFYALEQLAFLIFPSIESQHEQESRFPFHLRIEQLRERLEDEQKVDQPLAQEQLMLLALQELEHDLIALRKRSHPARDS